eukprot:CAMPEP_0170178958 /NCGR_PEP_ID=MMETSP0040_2-20121228/15543_1 /TAXON_ID=641309 /ORGANISM="Lotharella oceanica, Strain CCMP622" /LENGTH=47 /DNA_ID= /DNA_START= /DNA_END= /DNA_ORIENTATION=
MTRFVQCPNDRVDRLVDGDSDNGDDDGGDDYCMMLMLSGPRDREDHP